MKRSRTQGRILGCTAKMQTLFRYPLHGNKDLPEFKYQEKLLGIINKERVSPHQFFTLDNFLTGVWTLCKQTSFELQINNQDLSRKRRLTEEEQASSLEVVAQKRRTEGTSQNSTSPICIRPPLFLFQISVSSRRGHGERRGSRKHG